jgi:hypothetical protein
MSHAPFAVAAAQIDAGTALRHLIVLLSIVAAGVNITGIIPQLITMVRARSSRGQSPLGWTLAATCSGSLLFVNLVGYHADVLAAGNFLSLSGCLTAAGLALYFRNRGSVALEALQALHDAPEQLVSELPAPDLETLTEKVLEENHRRTGELIPEVAVTEMPTREFEALTELIIDEHHRRSGTNELELALA